MTSRATIKYEYPIFPDLTIPKGPLPPDKRAQACWYYYVLAQKVFEKVGDSIDNQFALYEEDMWMDKRYRSIAKSIALLYQLESPDEFAKFWEYVKRGAEQLRLPTPKEEYMKPCPRDIIH